MSLSLTHRKNLTEFVKTRCIHSASDDGRMEAFGAALPRGEVMSIGNTGVGTAAGMVGGKGVHS